MTDDRSSKCAGQVERAELIAVANDCHEINKLYRARRWGDGLPVIPPTVERVDEMLRHTRRTPQEVVAAVAPGFGEATVELIAINAVLAGCDPAYLPVVIAAVEAACAPKFNLQGIQATTNPATAWLIVNGPIAKQLEINSDLNCLGQGSWANATLGRALHLVLQNVGNALPGDMDRATQGQPGKYTFCCAENEARSPWTPLHVDRGYAAQTSAVTVVAASGTLNLLSHEKDAAQLLRVFAESMCYPASNDYWCGGEPWIVIGPEHAEILARAGLSKADVKNALWEQSKMPASRRAPKDYARTCDARRDELGEIKPDTILPIAPTPEEIGVIVAGGTGTHSVYIPSFGNCRSVTRPVA
ncbi:MAG: hypothetical protein HY525_16065 [Betaproteobacteria bacterium]|nr:hypothetical protein [Betaproteobacteria bacterium]